MKTPESVTNIKVGGKTPEEIKKGLAYCVNDSCLDCPYDIGLRCGDEVMLDALAYIQQLERERDAAVTDVKSLCATISFSGTYCEYCKYNEEDGQCHHPCKPYSSEWGWEWRGVKEDER